MSDVTLYGPPQSSYVRAARMACEEKGVSHELKPIEMKSPEHLALHPFGRVPILQHAGNTVYETSSIIRYVDETFSGPSLIPSDAGARATMETWISNVGDYLYADMVRNYVLQYVFPRGDSGAPDRSVIDKALPLMERDLKALEGALEGRDYIAGAFSLADLLVGPIISLLPMFPEGKKALGDFANVREFRGRFVERASFGATQPPPPS